MNTLSIIGVCFLFLVAGASITNFLAHIFFCLSSENLSVRFKNTYMATHTGNAIAATISLFIVFLISALFKYQFGFNFNTLFLFIGMSLTAFNFALRLDKKKQ